MATCLLLRILAVYLSVVQMEIEASFECYVCSYTRSSDPTVTYECVSGTNTSAIGVCQIPSMCKTITSFNQDMTHIRSVTRGCLPQVDYCAGDGCCKTDDVYPVCEQKCRSPRCNDVNPEKWLKKPHGEQTGTGKNDENTGTSITRNGFSISVLVLWTVLLHCI